MYIYKDLEKARRKKRIIFAFFTFFIAVVGSYLVQTYLSSRYGAGKNRSVNRLSSEIETEENINVNIAREDIIEEAMKSVVGISIIKANEESLFDISLTNKWNLGTGIIISENGYILTNEHLAKKENSKVIVNLEDGESVQGRVIWTEPNIDLSILKIDKEGLPVAKIGNSDNIRIGNSVLAIGNPLGVEFQRTTTSGIISGINRTLTFEENGETIFMEDLIQTDASINSGNSGGPLINESGEVIGINTVKITSAEGIGFAVPINIVIPIINKLIDDGKFEEAYLGIFAYDKEIIKYVKSNITIDNGIYITSVTKNGPAEKAGLKKNDIIISIDGLDLNKVTDLRRYIYTKEPGDEVTLIISRNNKIENVKVKLE